MTDELQELEPFDDQPNTPPTPPQGAGPAGAPMMAAGGSPILGAPAYNPAAGKEYFRFLFAGLLIFIGCMMPWGGQPGEEVGYHSIGGAITLFIAVGLIWTWWGSIAFNRFKGGALLWVVAALIPLFGQVIEIMNKPKQIQVPAIQTNEETGEVTLVAEDLGAALTSGDGLSVMTEKGEYGLGDYFGDAIKFSSHPHQVRARSFVAQFGAGRLIVLLGALWAELAMLLAIFGGAKEAKNQKKAAMSRSPKAGGDAGARPAKGARGKRRK